MLHHLTYKWDLKRSKLIKAKLDIVVILDDNVTLVKLLQFLNSLLPILFIEFGRTILFKLVQP